MQFQTADGTFRVQVVGQQTTTSRHTGRELRVLSCETDVRGEANRDRAMAIMKSAERDGADGIAGDDSTDGRWKLRNRGSRYQDEGPIRTIYNYWFEMEEIEDLRVTALELPGLVLHPYVYDESIDEDRDAIYVRARVLADPPTLTQLRALIREHEGADDRYFSVIRRGISDQPISMRFGSRFLWWHGDESTDTKINIILVEQAYDATSKRSPYSGIASIAQPMLDRTSELLAEKAEAFDELIAVLTDKGVLTPEDRQRIEDAVAKRAWDRMLGFERTSRDLDEWLDD